ncbi:MAG: O-antigen ligase family protein [Sedimentisphaerales bacterium]|nr:O-antigen ligase family protein [Sedimentisphaerales bacterium]
MKVQIKQQGKSRDAVGLVDIVLLLLVCVLVSGRGQISETLLQDRNTPVGAEPASQLTQGGSSTMIVLAGLIVAAAAVWVLVRAVRGQLRWRITGLVGPTALLAAAGITATNGASNKHTALVETFTVVGYMLLAILLTQLADKRWKQRLVLAAVAATGVCMAYRCWEQYRYELPATRAEYAENSAAMLAQQGIEPGTYAATQFEERLLSEDIGGYFTISNSAAAYFILTIMATGAVIALGARRAMAQQKWLWLILAAGALLVQLGGLALTRSKGGIGSFLLAALLVGLLGVLGNWLARRWRFWLAIGVIAVLLVVGLITLYGVSHGRLPTASMWVRWQYWEATGRMIVDHGLRGVGPENFGQYYPRYMDPAAPEVVKDPHCMWLALWSQWGIGGLAASIWAVGAVLVGLARPRKASDKTGDRQDNKEPASSVSGKGTVQDSDYGGVKWGWVFGLVIAAGVVIMRVATSAVVEEVNSVEWNSIVLLWFVVPAVVWLGAFMVMWYATARSREPSGAVNNAGISSYAVILLGCGLLGFLLHNSIDFAIWQGGIGTCFAALAAVAMSLKQTESGAEGQFTRLKMGQRLGMAGGALLVTIVFWAGLVVPIVRSQGALAEARRYAGMGTVEGMEQGKRWAERASELNGQDPQPWQVRGELNVALWYASQLHDWVRLNEALATWEDAARLDPQRAGGYRQLGNLADAAAEAAENEVRRAEYRDWSRGYWSEALALRPGDTKTLIRYGEILQDAGEPEAALAQFERAIEIDDAFLAMQRQMYPQREVLFLRLTESDRRRVEGRIAALRATMD